MADYIYLLEHRLSPAQRNALRAVRELARSKNLTVFLVGGAVRDLTSGSPVRDLDVVVQGNALKLKKDLEKIDATIMGEIESAQSLFVSFPGSVRMEIGSTLSVTYPKPGKPIFKPSSILDDLRRRDFTANAMALSLNEGSYGLLMDPLNGIADIENRELRLVSNYGFIEDPIRMVRAARFMARLGWTMDEKTAQRYATGKEEGYISSITDLQRGYETEEIFHEEDPLRVIKRLEAEGWMKDLAPFWTSAKVDVVGLEHLRATQTHLQMQGIHPDAASANFPLLTAKLSPKEIATLKAGFVRQGFVHDIDTLEAKAKELATLLSSKAAALPSQSWKILTSAAPEAVLAVAYSTKSTALQTKFKNFTSVWPQARQRIPYTLMQEMRIVPDLPGYDDLVETLFFELMDDKLQTPEEMKAFLEPYSPPAPPPPVNVRRPRAPKKDSKAAKGRTKKAIVVVAPDEDDDSEELTEELEEVLSEALDDGELPDEEPETPGDIDADEESDDDFDDDPPTKPSGKPSAKAASKPGPSSPAKVTVKAPAKPLEKGAATSAPAVASTKAPAKIHEKALPAKVTSASKAITQVKAATGKKAPTKKAAAPSHPSHRPVAPATGSKATSASKHPTKKIVAPAKKAAPKKATKFVAPSKKAPAKKIVAKTAPPSKTASKKSIPAKKRR